jgi:hypothetical protein
MQNQEMPVLILRLTTAYFVPKISSTQVEAVAEVVIAIDVIVVIGNVIEIAGNAEIMEILDGPVIRDSITTMQDVDIPVDVATITTTMLVAVLVHALTQAHVEIRVLNAAIITTTTM